MSYRSGTGFLDHFIPRGTGVLGAENTLAAVAVHGGHVCIKRCKVKALLFAVETAVVALTTAPVVKFWKQTSMGNTSTQSSLGTMTLPNGTAISKVVRRAITPVTFEVGDELSFEHITQVAGTGAAGIGYYGVEVDPVDEVPGSEADIVPVTS